MSEAIAQINSTKPHLLFLDIEMPGENGFELFKHFKEPDFKVVITTAYKEYAINAIKHSALDYLLKPINHIELLELVRKLEKQQINSQYRFRIETLISNLNDEAEAIPKIGFPTQTGVEFIKVNHLPKETCVFPR